MTDHTAQSDVAKTITKTDARQAEGAGRISTILLVSVAFAVLGLIGVAATA